MPISYVNRLAQQIGSDDPLGLAEQSSLVHDLKSALRDPKTERDAYDLLQQLRARRDLFATIAVEIDGVLSSKPNNQRRASRLQPPARTASALSEASLRFLDNVEDRAAGGAKIGRMLMPWGSKDPSKLRRVAGQRIWKHWVMALAPGLTCYLFTKGGITNAGWWFALLFTLITGSMTVISLRNPIPVLAAVLFFLPIVSMWIVLFRVDAPLSLNLAFLCAGILWVSLSELVIQQARKQLAIQS